jgi:CubicO group peptidase (beta-lactamase class C family)
MITLPEALFSRAPALAARLAVLLIACWVTAATAAPWPTTTWAESAPEAQGVDSAALVGLYEALGSGGARNDSVLLVRHGYIVSEVYFAPYRSGIPHDLRSVTKTVVGMLVGAAIQRHALRSVDQRVFELLPGHASNDARKAELTIGHLLEMRTGVRWREWPYDSQSDVIRMAASPNWVKYILDRPMATNPGTSFQYAGAAAHLLSAVLTRATGESAATYAGSELFGPLGITQYVWLKDPQGNSIGESGLSLMPRDLAKLGYLHLHDGVWDGSHLLPEGWVRRIFLQASPHGLRSPLLPPQYETLWWVDKSVPMAIASGRHGQTLVVLPTQDAVLVMTGKTDDVSDSPLNVPALVRARLIPALHSQPLPQNTTAQRRLRETTARLSALSVLPGIPTPAMARAVSGRRYAFGPNRQNISSIRLDLSGSGPSAFTMAWRSQATPAGEVPLTRPFGGDGRFALSAPTYWGTFASRGRWIDAKTLLIQSEAQQGSTTTTLQFRFTGNLVELTVTDNDGTHDRLTGRLKCRLEPFKTVGSVPNSE